MLISFSPNFFKNCGEKVLDEIFSLNTVCDKISFFFDQSLSNDTTLKACIENTNINTGFLEQYKDKVEDAGIIESYNTKVNLDKLGYSLGVYHTGGSRSCSPSIAAVGYRSYDERGHDHAQRQRDRSGLTSN